MKYHRVQIREHFNFKEFSLQDGKELKKWIYGKVFDRNLNITSLKEGHLRETQRKGIRSPFKQAPRSNNKIGYL